MMRTYPVFAILPVKSFDRAKSRLAPLLSPAERATLARIMLEDVLTSLNKARGLARSVVVTDDSAVAALAGAYGAAVVGGGAADGINVAINRGIATLPISTPCGVIVVPTDIPHIQPRDVETLAGRVATRASILLVPASRDDGTNILAYSPHDLIRPSFGKASFPRHIAGARGVGIEPEICALDRLDLDLDVPSDLLEFLAVDINTRTHAFLKSLNLDERWRSNRRSPLGTTLRKRKGRLPRAADAMAEVN